MSGGRGSSGETADTADAASRATLEELMHAAADVARLAGDYALGHFREHALRVDTKDDGSPVTAADRGAEERARAWIEARFPDDGILGEEFGTVRPRAPRRWIVDPIDGTKSFIRGVPLWGTLVAVAEGERVLAGAVYVPAGGELVAAAPGCGAWWNGVRCRVSAVSALDQATVLTTDDRFPTDGGRRTAFARLAAAAGVSRTWGDCYGYLLVATGRAEVMVDDVVSPWDAAALLPVITEAGGSFTSWQGAPTAFGGDAIATNAALAGVVRDLLSPAAVR
jgi:histidinol phosphatase-like enzyme (inositol monophosphatase family)